METWKVIKGYEGLYQISNQGNLRSLDRITKTSYRIRHIKGKTISMVIGNAGYLRSVIYKNGKQQNISLHRIVAETFILNPLNLPQVNHKDGNKTNNRVENLEWVTPSINWHHARKNSLIKNVGETSHRAKLSIKQVREIRQKHLAGLGAYVIAKQYGVSGNCIYQIIVGNSWQFCS